MENILERLPETATQTATTRARKSVEEMKEEPKRLRRVEANTTDPAGRETRATCAETIQDRQEGVQSTRTAESGAVSTRPGFDSDHISLSGLKRRGWTDYVVRRFLGKPDKISPNPRYCSAAPMLLYATERVMAAEATPAWLSWFRDIDSTRRAKKVMAAALAAKAKADEKARSEERSRLLVEKYGSWQNALPDACEFLFQLNRYAKHEACGDGDRAEIYDLKRQMIRLLYQGGYTTDCYRQSFQTEADECWTCDGTGDDDHYPCFACSGTGIYRASRTLHFVCFRFQVGSRKYTWHQPEKLVQFPISVTRDEVSFTPTDEEKEVTLPPCRMAGAKHLIGWVIRASQDDLVNHGLAKTATA